MSSTGSIPPAIPPAPDGWKPSPPAPAGRTLGRYATAQLLALLLVLLVALPLLPLILLFVAWVRYRDRRDRV